MLVLGMQTTKCGKYACITWRAMLQHLNTALCLVWGMDPISHDSFVMYQYLLIKSYLTGKRPYQLPCFQFVTVWNTFQVCRQAEITLTTSLGLFFHTSQNPFSHRRNYTSVFTGWVVLIITIRLTFMSKISGNWEKLTHEHISGKGSQLMHVNRQDADSLTTANQQTTSVLTKLTEP